VQRRRSRADDHDLHEHHDDDHDIDASRHDDHDLDSSRFVLESPRRERM
jgi:hypothetical protein